MFRAVASNIVKRAVQRSSLPQRTVVGGFNNSVRYFQATSCKLNSAAAAAATTPAKEEEEKAGGFWDPIYSIPLGIVFAVPAIHYEWYLVNEETQLAACFIAFIMIIYKNFGGNIYEFLEEDGKRILAEHNAVEDQVIDILNTKLQDIKVQENVVQDAETILALKEETYAKLNAAGQIKPQYDFKAQMERLLAQIAVEEAALQEKAKHAMMAEATIAVTRSFASSDSLKKSALDNAISQLKGGKSKGDPVQKAYVDFFKKKAADASQVDEKAELLKARGTIVTKLNAIAMNEGFFFNLDEKGNPKMTV